MNTPEQRPQGLSSAEARLRLDRDGANEIPATGKRTLGHIALDVIKEPMLFLLAGAGLIYLLLGDKGEAAVLLVFACVSIVITVVQEARTERVLESLRDLTSPQALVIRDGTRMKIPGRNVVRGDLLVLAEGDRIAADVRLTEALDLQTDESLLTGESVPVRKLAATEKQLASELATAASRPGGDDLPFAFSGTLVVRGTGIGEVTATGVTSEIGRIGQSLGELEAVAPRLQTQTRKLVTVFAIVGASVSLLVVLLYGMLRGSWLDALLAGIAVGMSMLPEEFPMVLTVFMAMGAWRISQARVLTRRASAIESLGSATVLCTDKTGTLTENRMSIQQIRLPDGQVVDVRAGEEKLPESIVSLVRIGMLACAPEPFDPMEKAFHVLAQRSGAAAPGDAGNVLKLHHGYALRPELLAMSQVWKQANEEAGYLIATKGAPEAIAELCRMTPDEREKIRQAVEDMAEKGLRVLGVAQAMHSQGPLPETQSEFAFEFLGLVGLMDPLRPSVPEAIRECREAGIRVIMITGDHPATAGAIARQAGLQGESMVTGSQLQAMSDEQLAIRVREVTVFARIMPEQKLRIVQALKANGDIVAMTGDGVNDAPSLKASHIGVAMGGRGTDVAREASSIVLLDDDFGSIVKTVRLGRRIYDNLRKAMAFIMAVHVPIAGLALLPLLFGMPLVLGPMHIAFLEMVIDPVCSLVFEAEAEEDDVMRRPPRDPEASLFSGALIGWSVFQGALVLGVVAAIFMTASARGLPEAEVRALTFCSLVLGIVALIFVNRSSSASPLKAIRRPGVVLALILAGIAALLATTLYWPPVTALFRFGPLQGADLAVALGAGAIVMLALEFVKPFWSRFSPVHR